MSSLSQSVLILSTQRSGSNYLGTLIESHPQVDYFGEVMKDVPEESKQYYSYFFFRNQSFFKKIMWSWISKNEIAKDYYEFVSSLKSSEENIVVFKGMINQLGKYPELQNLPVKFRVVKLLRKNLLRRHISIIQAVKTNQYILKDSNNRKDLNIEIDTKTLVNDLERLKKQNGMILESFSKNSSHLLYYEDLIFDYKKELKRVFEWLELPSEIDASSPLLIQNVKQTSDIILNFEEVKSTLGQTEYEEFLYL